MHFMQKISFKCCISLILIFSLPSTLFLLLFIFTANKINYHFQGEDFACKRDEQSPCIMPMKTWL